jgi:formate-dependent nitrite reductase membrane component NrfD
MNASEIPVEVAPTYYERPLLKAPVWIWTIPTYFFVGGVAGAAMTLGLAVQVLGGRELRRFGCRCYSMGAVGGSIGSVLLIMDLGRKARFLNMLRVLRPGSPMSVGSWVLALATPLSAGSALLTLCRGGLWAAGYAMGVGAGLLGMPLATYTGVLLGNTAVPLWSTTRTALPVLFGASSAASLASVLELMPLEARARRTVHRLGIIGRAGEMVAAHAAEHQACANPRIGAPLISGTPGMLWKASKILTLSSLALTLIPGRRSLLRRTGAVLGVLAGLSLRFAVFHAGKVSASDPRAATVRLN